MPPQNSLDFSDAAKLKGWSYPVVHTGWRHIGEIKILAAVLAAPFVILAIYYAFTWKKYSRWQTLKKNLIADLNYFLSWKWFDLLDEDGELNWFWWMLVMTLFMMTWLL